jgi:hypothetical protein
MANLRDCSRRARRPHAALVRVGEVPTLRPWLHAAEESRLEVLEILGAMHGLIAQPDHDLKHVAHAVIELGDQQTLASKVEELQQSNADLRNLFESTSLNAEWLSSSARARQPAGAQSTAGGGVARSAAEDDW